MLSAAFRFANFAKKALALALAPAPALAPAALALALALALLLYWNFQIRCHKKNFCWDLNGESFSYTDNSSTYSTVSPVAPSCGLDMVSPTQHSGERTPFFDVQLEVTAIGSGVDIPVYVEREVIDLRICLLDRLYQSSVILKNR